MNPFSALWQNALLPFAVSVLTGLSSGVSHIGPLSALGSFGVGVIVLTVIVRTLLLPLAWLAKRWKGRRAVVLGLLVSVIQYPFMLALYYAVRSVATKSAGLDFHFLWVSDVTQSPYDVCCLVMQNGQAVTDSAGNTVHSAMTSGLLSHPAAALLPVIAVVLSIATGLLQIGKKKASMSKQQRRQRTVSQQLTVIGTIPIILIGLVVAQAVALYWITQTVYGVAQNALFRRMARPRQPSPGVVPAAAVPA